MSAGVPEPSVKYYGTTFPRQDRNDSTQTTVRADWWAILPEMAARDNVEIATIRFRDITEKISDFHRQPRGLAGRKDQD